MTAEPLHPDETNPDESAGEVLHFEDPNADRDRTGDRQPFRIGDDDTILWARRPKLAALINIAARIGDADDIAMAGAALDFLQVIVEGPVYDQDGTTLLSDSRGYLTDRIEDEDDDLDIDALIPPMEHFLGQWYGRPTGPRAASARSRKRTGTRSTVRRR
jgi:hypothetical protein